MSSPGGGWVFTGRARRDLQRLDRPIQRRIIDALDRLTGEPPAGDVVKLTGVEDELRPSPAAVRKLPQRRREQASHALLSSMLLVVRSMSVPLTR